MKPSKHRQVHRCSCAVCRAHPYSQTAAQHQAINRVLSGLDERNRRRFAGLLVLQFGPRHVLRVSQITGLCRISESEAHRINTEAAAALEEWISLMLFREEEYYSISGTARRHLP